jgi:hypothetical protein
MHRSGHDFRDASVCPPESPITFPSTFSPNMRSDTSSRSRKWAGDRDDFQFCTTASDEVTIESHSFPLENTGTNSQYQLIHGYGLVIKSQKDLRI